MPTARREQWVCRAACCASCFVGRSAISSSSSSARAARRASSQCSASRLAAARRGAHGEVPERRLLVGARMTSRRIARAASARASRCSAGCAAEAPSSRRSTRKGRTESRATALVTLARPAPRFSEAARDYLYLAPVEVNEHGHAASLPLARARDDRRSRVGCGRSRACPQRSCSCSTACPSRCRCRRGTRRRRALRRRRRPTSVRRAQVTLDQLERLATAASIEVELADGADGVRASFAPWRGQWSELAAVRRRHRAAAERPRLSAARLEAVEQLAGQRLARRRNAPIAACVYGVSCRTP